MKKEYEDIVPLRAMSKVYTLCYLLQAQLNSMDEEKYTQAVLEKVFVYSMIWSFGGPLPEDKVNNFRRNFSRFWIDTFKDIILPLKEGQSVFDIYYDLSNDSWEGWDEIVPEYIPPSELNFSKVVVQTAETTVNQKAGKQEQCSCNYRKNHFLSIHFSFIVFSVVTAFQTNPTSVY